MTALETKKNSSLVNSPKQQSKVGAHVYIVWSRRRRRVWSVLLLDRKSISLSPSSPVELPSTSSDRLLHKIETRRRRRIPTMCLYKRILHGCKHESWTKKLADCAVQEQYQLDPTSHFPCSTRTSYPMYTISVDKDCQDCIRLDELAVAARKKIFDLSLTIAEIIEAARAARDSQLVKTGTTEKARDDNKASRFFKGYRGDDKKKSGM